MNVALLIGRLGLALVFAVAGAAKLADGPGSGAAVTAFRVPERWVGISAVLLPGAEFVTAVVLVPVATARYGALYAGVLLFVFVLRSVPRVPAVSVPTAIASDRRTVRRPMTPVRPTLMRRRGDH